MVEVTEQEGQNALQSMLAEVDAMHAALRLVSASSYTDDDVREARDLTRKAFAGFAEPQGFEAQVTACAMGYILGEDVRKFVPKTPTPSPWEQHVFEVVGRVWTLWAVDPSSPAPLAEIKQLRHEQKMQEDVHVPQNEGAVHLMALYFWSYAIEALAMNDLDNAKRLWRRAMEVGSSFGTDSHPVVLWSYAATFFP